LHGQNAGSRVHALAGIHLNVGAEVSSILGSKGGMKVTSTRRESDGARVYEA
jgi:hypothetical protein